MPPLRPTQSRKARPLPRRPDSLHIRTLRPDLGPLLVLLAAAIGTASVASAQPPDVGRASEIACAPRFAAGTTLSTLAVLGSQDGTAKLYFGPSDTLLISGGHADGVEIGHEYFVRRVVSSRFNASAASVLHTAGWVRIVGADREVSIAEVVHVCDGLRQGDFLEPLVLPADVDVHAGGEPDYDNAGKILFGLDGRLLIAEHQYFVAGLGSANDVAPGQRFTVFRHTFGGLNAVTEIGEAVAVAVDDEWTTARLTHLSGVVEVGDLIAPQR